MKQMYETKVSIEVEKKDSEAYEQTKGRSIRLMYETKGKL
jgi:hypothetical protein